MGRGFAHVTHFCLRNCGLRNNLTSPFGELLSTNACTTDFAYRTYGAWATHAKA